MSGKLLVQRIDGPPVLNDRIKAYLPNKKEDQFFFSRRYLLKYHSASSPAAKNPVPGATFITKILKCFDTHYRVGVLFMEFLSKNVKMKTVIFVITGVVFQLGVFHSHFLILQGHYTTCMLVLHLPIQMMERSER